MMNQNLTLGYSTCPNDTYIFHALVHGLVACGGLDFSVTLKDVEALNQDARNDILDVSKLSFAALGHLGGSYGLLRSGAALGRGCGPLIVSRPDTDFSRLAEQPVAVPGMWTTANLLLGMYVSQTPYSVPMPFERIMPAVSSGEVDFGVIIHEGRFTFPAHDLVQQLDLGQWWEDETGLPIPLGGIAIRRGHAPQLARKVERGIRDSVLHARKNPAVSKDYVQHHAQEMGHDVIARHIGLYVNDFTIELGPEGETAVTSFFEMAVERGLLPSMGDAGIFAVD